MNESVAQKNKRLAIRLLLLVVAMLGFCMALIPLYDVMTDASGINGKIRELTVADATTYQVDKTRSLTVDLLTSVAKDTLLAFSTNTSRLQVHPGQIYSVNYTVQNLSDKTLRVHANPSVSPGLAAAQVKMLQCFCFDKQRLNPGEQKVVSMQFVIDPELPAQYKNIVVAQQFFKTQ